MCILVAVRCLSSHTEGGWSSWHAEDLLYRSTVENRDLSLQVLPTTFLIEVTGVMVTSTEYSAQSPALYCIFNPCLLLYGVLQVKLANNTNAMNPDPESWININ